MADADTLVYDLPDTPPPDAFCILRQDGSVDEARDPRLSDDVLLDMYRHMLRARIIDDRATTPAPRPRLRRDHINNRDA